jgi:ribosome-associated translation inhibitor RaiA
MKIQIRPRGISLTKTQRARLERDLDSVLARFGERIDRVVVEVSDGKSAGLKCCEIEVRLKAQIVKVEHSDTDVLLAMGHAAQHVARSVSRAIETEGLARR